MPLNTSPQYGAITPSVTVAGDVVGLGLVRKEVHEAHVVRKIRLAHLARDGAPTLQAGDDPTHSLQCAI